MNIGVTNAKSFKVDDGNGGKKDKSYLEMSIRPPFMESATFTITTNANKENDNAPDFFINYSFNRRGENYPRARVGALWNKTSKDGDTTYIGGHIESPLFATGKMYISIFKAKAFDNSPPPKHRHDVVWSPPLAQNNDTDYSQHSQEPQTYQAPANQAQKQEGVPIVEIEEDEIPF